VTSPLFTVRDAEGEVTYEGDSLATAQRAAGGMAEQRSPVAASESPWQPLVGGPDAGDGRRELSGPALEHFRDVMAGGRPVQL